MLDIICASRGRPAYCKDMVESARKTAHTDIGVLVGVDADDPCLPEYQMIDGITLYVIPRGIGGCCEIINTLAEVSRAKLMQFMGDDCLMVTDGWDRKLLDAVPPDEIAVVCGLNKEQRPKRQPYHFAFTKKWRDIVGWVAMPNVHHYGIDTLIAHMANSVGRLVWVDDVIIEHRHYQRSPDGIKKDGLYEANEKLATRDNSIIRRNKVLYNEKIRLLQEAIDENSIRM